MSTVVLNAYSKDYPTITNRIRASVYLQTSPEALVASEIDSTPGHPERVWSFPGLPRANYGFSLDEINALDQVIQNLAAFAVVPGEIDGLLERGDEQPECDVTPGFVSGTNTFTFDGQNGTPDYVGWEIVPSELNGRGILIRGVDYSWDKVTGTFVLLQPGDIFYPGVYYNIHFDVIITEPGNSVPVLSAFDFQIIVLTASNFLTASIFGKKLIVEPNANYIELDLPDISTVPEGRPLFVEVSRNAVAKTVKFVPYGTDTINFMFGSLYAMPQENFTIYKHTISAGVYEWRVCSDVGSFSKVGNIINSDAMPTDVFGMIEASGASLDKLQYARLYNEFVLRLPLAQVVNYDDWSLNNNYTKYSFANSSNPLFAGLFHVPDRRNLYARMNLLGVAGDYQKQSIVPHKHTTQVGCVNDFAENTEKYGRTTGLYFSAKYNGTATTNRDIVSNPCESDGTPIPSAGETRPESYLINQYIIY